MWERYYKHPDTGNIYYGPVMTIWVVDGDPGNHYKIIKPRPDPECEYRDRFEWFFSSCEKKLIEMDPQDPELFLELI